MAELVPGTGYFEVAGGLAKPWGQALTWEARAEAGWRPTARQTLGARAYANGTAVGALGFYRLDF